MDSDRLVFPPTPALLIIAFFYGIYVSLLTYPVFCCFASGKLFGKLFGCGMFSKKFTHQVTFATMSVITICTMASLNLIQICISGELKKLSEYWISLKVVAQKYL